MTNPPPVQATSAVEPMPIPEGLQELFALIEKAKADIDSICGIDLTSLKDAPDAG